MTFRAGFRVAARTAAAVLVFIAAAAVPAAAQTVALTESHATVLRGGDYANTNLSSERLLVTRASQNPTYVRRTLLKFDTQNSIPLKTPITSATLTLTVAGGNGEKRQLAAYRVRSSYEETSTTWNRRNGSVPWSRAGADLAELVDTASVTNTIGSRVTFDVTALVQGAVNGAFGSSRFSRIALVDPGPSSRASYKEYHSDEASIATARPVLRVVLGATDNDPDPNPAPAPDPATGSTLRVLQWNIHHGGFGTDGRYDTDRVATWIAKMNPDVITLNEVEKYTGWGNQDQPEVYRKLLEKKTGKTWYYVFAQEYGQWSSNGKGNMILSRVPFKSTDRYELMHNSDRSVAAAVITWNGRDITLATTHLDPYSHSLRLKQAVEVITWAAPEPENRIITGDMNAWPDQTSIAQFNKFYKDSWSVAASMGTAKAFGGNSGETKKGRIDYIFYSKTASNLVVTSSQVYDTRDARGVMPSDHRPVLTTFKVR
jgi:endonuclease/exonuclease/phosphatase family metal-dependent hydrolase